jgi:YgiT-type zinc finger domain-containing protein
MNCSICKEGLLAPGRTTVVLSRGESTVVIKGVPADVCDTCAEYYLSDDVAGRVYAVAEDAVRAGAEVQIVRFAA